MFKRARKNPTYTFQAQVINPFRSPFSCRSLSLGYNIGWLTGHKRYKSLFSPRSIKRTTAYGRALVPCGILGCHSRDLLQREERRRFLLAKLKLTKHLMSEELRSSAIPFRQV